MHTTPTVHQNNMAQTFQLLFTQDIYHNYTSTTPHNSVKNTLNITHSSGNPQLQAPITLADTTSTPNTFLISISNMTSFAVKVTTYSMAEDTFCQEYACSESHASVFSDFKFYISDSVQGLMLLRPAYFLILNM